MWRRKWKLFLLLAPRIRSQRKLMHNLVKQSPSYMLFSNVWKADCHPVWLSVLCIVSNCVFREALLIYFRFVWAWVLSGFPHIKHTKRNNPCYPQKLKLVIFSVLLTMISSYFTYNIADSILPLLRLLRGGIFMRVGVVLTCECELWTLTLQWRQFSRDLELYCQVGNILKASWLRSFSRPAGSG